MIEKNTKCSLKRITYSHPLCQFKENVNSSKLIALLNQSFVASIKYISECGDIAINLVSLMSQIKIFQFPNNENRNRTPVFQVEQIF